MIQNILSSLVCIVLISGLFYAWFLTRRVRMHPLHKERSPENFFGYGGTFLTLLVAAPILLPTAIVYRLFSKKKMFPIYQCSQADVLTDGGLVESGKLAKWICVPIFFMVAIAMGLVLFFMRYANARRASVRSRKKHPADEDDTIFLMQVHAIENTLFKDY
ncbi:hypothetical protein H7F10_07085 [Acidithiobacillus sp. HP-6]|uniref:hypothetical protein n=1 Tax=unclassified Acidithiobacillus TaxID=2614800 RepID=UPI001879EFE2|nr:MULTISPECIES: hypothetical protein [unclassified Acidithiobacillus]MBE7562716.1 hypothetical protein [Acidithiobacillus sp. HP-6]MBE7570488.1 hypothetical protein [Acidithiobacillus sp. HP-2]